jgi:uncharacterized protein (TIGR02284 family)
MSTDADVTQKLIKTLTNGQEGFTKAAEKLAEHDRQDLANRFRGFATQRAEFARELQALGGEYGDRLEKEGTAPGALHRGWMAVKDMLSGSNVEGVLDAAEQGEDHAVTEYENALNDDALSGQLRAIIERQGSAVKAAHDEVRSLRDAA